MFDHGDFRGDVTADAVQRVLGHVVIYLHYVISILEISDLKHQHTSSVIAYKHTKINKTTTKV